MSILLYGCTTWTLTKRLEKKPVGNYTKMLQAILNRSWRQHPKKQQLYGHLPPITKTIQVRRTRHARHCWRSRDELISDVLLGTPSHGWAKAGLLTRTYEVHNISFQTFFVWGLLLIVHTWISSPLRSNLLRLQFIVVLFQQLLEGPMKILLCERVNDLRHSLFHLLNSLITTASELRE